MSAISKILLVDDSPGHISLLGGVLGDDYDLLVANNGREALDLVDQEVPDLILLDVVMPGMDGYEVCHRLKSNSATKDIPVVFTTANTAVEEVVKGLEAGASYYLTKPIDTKLLRAVVKSVLTEQAESRVLQEKTQEASTIPCNFLDSGSFSIRTTDEAHDLAVLLSQLCPDPIKSVLGFGELLVNAVEHGNLGITYAEKTKLFENDCWNEEVERRLNLPENRDKRVRVQYETVGDERHFLIVDEGEGFDWKPYLEIDPNRVFDSHGRGIAMASKVGFGIIEYRNKGNEVLVTVSQNGASGPEND